MALGQLDRTLLRSRYPALNDFLDWPSRDQVRRQQLVGREWVFEQLADFSSRRCGYLHIVADAGLGKTALAAAIAARYQAPAFFFSASDGRTRPQRCLDHLSVELIERHRLPHDRLPEHSGEDSGFLLQLLSEIDNAEHALWLIVDALDEADPVGSVGNPAALPRQLPPGVFVVMTHRPGDYRLNVGPRIAQDELRIVADDARHARDIKSYLQQRAAQADTTNALARVTPPVSPAQFGELLATASEGNFMYIDYFLADLVDQRTPTLDLAKLPHGLLGYYREMWRVIHADADRDSERWEHLHLPVLERLAAAGEPVSAAWFSDQLAMPERAIRRVLRRWRRFLQQTSDGRWRILHQSFLDYLATTDELDLETANQAIADYYLTTQQSWARTRTMRPGT